MSKSEQIEELQEILREDSENYRARRELALILVDFGFAKEASQHLLYLIKKINNDSSLYFNLGISFEKQKLFKKAKSAYLKALEITPDLQDAIYNLGLVYTELHEYDKGIECFNRIVKQDGNDSNSYFNLGICYFKKGDYVKAIINFQNAIDINDADIYAHFYIGNILFEMKEYNSAKDAFLKVIELSPDYSWAYYNLACIAYEENDYQAVSDNLNKTIELNPKDEEAYYKYAKFMIKMDMYEEAKTIIQAAIDNCTNKGKICYMAAQLSKAVGNIDDCTMYLNNSLEHRDTLENISVDKIMSEIEKVNT